jgi:hypothetical protein
MKKNLRYTMKCLLCYFFISQLYSVTATATESKVESVESKVESVESQVGESCSSWLLAPNLSEGDCQKQCSLSCSQGEGNKGKGTTERKELELQCSCCCYYKK